MTFRKSNLIVRKHTTLHSPVGLWQLDGDMTDESGNAFTLTVEAGTERYTGLPGGLSKGFYFDGSTQLWRSVSEATLQLLGDMTIELVINFLDGPPGLGSNVNKHLVVYTGDGTSELETNNVLYTLRTHGVPGLGYLAEHSAGTNIGPFIMVDGVPQGWAHLALVRSTDDVTLYVNGVGVEVPSSGLAAPTGGSLGKFRIGGNDPGAGVRPVCVMSSVKLIASALTAQQVVDEYGRTLG